MLGPLGVVFGGLAAAGEQPFRVEARRSCEFFSPSSDAGKLLWRLLSFVMLVLPYPGVLRAQLPGSEAANPFAELHASINRAADMALEQTAEDARRAAESAAGPRPRSTGLSAQLRRDLATTFPFAPPIPVSARLRSMSAAQQRLRALGVDAGRIFAEEGVPLEFLTVAGVESGFDPAALSRKGARGLWQLMPETAAQLGLRVDDQVDDRLHPVRSTRAAARYLRKLHLKFGDWLLALAAYNVGEARIAQAIERAGTENFWEIAARGGLPEETRRYVPAVLAAIQEQ